MINPGSKSPSNEGPVQRAERTLKERLALWKELIDASVGDVELRVKLGAVIDGAGRTNFLQLFREERSPDPFRAYWRASRHWLQQIATIFDEINPAILKRWREEQDPYGRAPTVELNEIEKALVVLYGELMQDMNTWINER